MNKPITLDLILPVHNEAEHIQHVIDELYREISPKIAMRFIISENGSTDTTKSVLTRLAKRFPMKLLLSQERKGYAQSVLEGMRASTSPYVFCIDADGQYSPKDFWKLWNSRKNNDVVVGYRKHRADPVSRVMMSRLFFYLFRPLFPHHIHDPSCSFVLVRKRALQKLMPLLGLTTEGFWWEVMVRVRQYGLYIEEREIAHRRRLSGKTKVYDLLQLPRIAYTHSIAMMRMSVSGYVRA